MLLLLGPGILVAAIYWPRDEPDFPRQGRIGEQVTDGWLVYRVTELRCGMRSIPEIDDAYAPDRGQYCRVNLEVRNPDESSSIWNVALEVGADRYPAEYHVPARGWHLAPGRSSRTVSLFFDIPSGKPDALVTWIYDDSVALINIRG
ncbi:MAG TPA: hypothetical protein VHJ17_03615 [Thermomonospora sp.]|nr:hypothetical protein [Thermomonospora sp.]